MAKLPRGRGPAEEWSVLLGAVARALGVAPTPPPLPDLRDPGIYLNFFLRTLDFVIFPNKNRHPVAVTAGVGDKARAWGRLVGPARTDVPDPEWRRREQIDRLGFIFARLSHKIGDCRLPLIVGPSIATDRRISRNRKNLGANDAEHQEFFKGTSRNVAKARLRLGSGHARLQAGPNAGICVRNGNALNELSGNEVLLASTDATLPENTSFPALGRTWNTF